MGFGLNLVRFVLVLCLQMCLLSYKVQTNNCLGQHVGQVPESNRGG